jgi:excisionase family DNA binding protein
MSRVLPPESQEAFTRKQVASKFQVSESVINKWIREGKVRVIKLGRCVRISAAELQRVLQGGIQ